MAPLDQFILFGDSITQAAHDQDIGFAFGSALQAAYVRRLDIINRGFSGYTTHHALGVIEHVIPTPEQASVRFLLIWFGANDCNREPSDTQYVPIEQYRQNLIALVNHSLVKAQAPKTILVTPGPMEETMLRKLKEEQEVPSHEIRKAKDAGEYAAVVKEVGRETGVAVLDIWSMFMEKAGWDGGSNLPGSEGLGKNLVLEGFLYDGLHLNADGYRVVYDALIKLIIETWPEQNPETMKFVVRNELDFGWEQKQVAKEG